MYEKIETKIEGTVSSQTMYPHVDELYINLVIDSKAEHYSTTIYFKNIEEFDSFYNQYKSDADNNKIWISGNETMYTIYPDVFEKKDNSDFIEKMTRDEMIKYIKNGNTHLMAERLDGFTLFQNMDFMNHKYMKYPSMIIQDEKKPNIIERKSYKGYQINKTYYKDILSKNDLDDILLYNEKFITDALKKYNTTYLYNIRICVIYVTESLKTIAYIRFNLA